MMLRVLMACCLFGLVTSQVNDPHVLPGRHVMVHLFEWRWKDIATECEQFLGPNGYAGVQTSPANENAIVNTTENNRPWWERYQPISYNLTTRSGDEQTFADMVARCNAVGVRVYVDAVLNHMTNNGNPTNILYGTGGSIAYPDDRYFPAVPFFPEHTNRGCTISNITDPTVEEFRNCDLGNLVDLNQGVEHVRNKISEYLDKLVSFGVAGFRIDAARHMWPDDLEIIFARVRDLNTTFNFPANARAYQYHEVIDLGDSPIPPSDYFRLGPVTEFKYSNELGLTFSGTEGRTLANLSEFAFADHWGFMPNESAFVFVDNHDNQRGHCGECSPDVLSYKRPRLYVMGTAFHLAWTYGFQRIMSSFDFTDTESSPPMDSSENTLPVITNPDGSCGNGWVCEHRWPQIVGMVGFRAAVDGTPVQNFWNYGAVNHIAFCRGDRGFIAFNNDATLDMSETLQTCLSPGIYCDVISGRLEGIVCTGKSITVQSNGAALIEIRTTDPDGVVAFHINAKLP